VNTELLYSVPTGVALTLNSRCQKPAFMLDMFLL